jgi:L-alanine-DL-glutamate epimerase-like enolase superfamily enzyme
MNLTWEPITLDLKTPFRIAHGVSEQRHNVVVRIDEGIGEAAAVTYHGETQEGIIAYLTKLDVDWGDDPFQLEEILNQLPDGSRAARAAIDIALHDRWGRRVGQPLYRLFGLNPQRLPLTSFTIPIDAPEVMAQRARDVALPIIKIKLGGANDEAIVRAIRETSDAKLRIDVNAGWTREQAIDLIPRLAQYDLELIEQPLAVGDIDGLRVLRALQPRAPIFVDESIKSMADIVAHADGVDGVVIKLAKSCGLREALRQITLAHALGLQVMLGCMVETSIAVTAAAHIAALVEYVDLDGPLLIANDPYRGVRYEGARLILPSGAGLGLSPRGA